MTVNEGCVGIDQEATTVTSGLFFPHVIAVYKHAYIYWFAQGLWGVGGIGSLFCDIVIELLPIYDWELIIINVWIGWIHIDVSYGVDLSQP